MNISKIKAILAILTISGLVISGFAEETFAQVTPQICEQCGMTVDVTSQSHLRVTDSNGAVHYVECLKCAFKLLKNYTDLTISTNCDWNGPTYVITITLKNYVNTTTVTPQTALFIDGSCAKNRVVYNQAAANALLANNGLSPYLAQIQNVTIPTNATVMTIADAATLYAFTQSPTPTPTPTPTPSPSPSPSPSPAPNATVSPAATETPLPTAIPTATSHPTKNCEACGMDVPSDAQDKYVITDGSGTVHYAECFMCALNLINDYDQLTIKTYCDWYGPNYTVTVQSSQYGKVVDVTPSTAMFLDGGNCIINRVAYNQTAANELLANGYSQYTLHDQHYSLPTNTKVSTVKDATAAFANVVSPPSNQTPVLLIVSGVAGVAIIGAAIGAYWKIKRQ